MPVISVTEDLIEEHLISVTDELIEAHLAHAMVDDSCIIWHALAAQGIEVAAVHYDYVILRDGRNIDLPDKVKDWQDLIEVSVEFLGAWSEKQFDTIDVDALGGWRPKPISFELKF